MSKDDKIVCKKVGDQWVVEMICINSLVVSGCDQIIVKSSTLAHKIHQLAKQAYWNGRKDLQNELRELLGVP